MLFCVGHLVRILSTMGGKLSPFWKTPDQKEREGKLILPRQLDAEDEIANYASINDSATSCAPCAGIARRSCVNCPTCQGTGRIPRGRWFFLVSAFWAFRGWYRSLCLKTVVESVGLYCIQSRNVLSWYLQLTCDFYGLPLLQEDGVGRQMVLSLGDYSKHTLEPLENCCFCREMGTLRLKS